LDPAPDVLADDSDRVRGGDVRDDDDDAGDDEGDPKPNPDALLAPPPSSVAARFLAVNDATPTPVEGRSAGVLAARPKQERAGSAAGKTKAFVVAAAARDRGSSGASDVAKRAPSRGRRRRRGVDWIIVGREVAPRLLLAVAPRRRVTAVPSRRRSVMVGVTVTLLREKRGSSNLSRNACDGLVLFL
jgi:hypothetical protein